MNVAFSSYIVQITDVNATIISSLTQVLGCRVASDVWWDKKFFIIGSIIVLYKLAHRRLSSFSFLFPLYGASGCLVLDYLFLFPAVSYLEAFYPPLFLFSINIMDSFAIFLLLL